MNRDDPDKMRRRDASEIEKKIVENAKLGVPLATLGLATLAGVTMGAPAVILVLAGGALIAVIAVFWASVRTLAGETPLSGADAYALGAPRAEEEQKRAVLRALKDLEFERSVGKISDEDYKALVTKYRAEAKRLLRVLDEDAQPRREQIERLVQKRLRSENLLDDAPEQEAESKPAEASEAKAEPGAPADHPGGRPGAPKKRKKTRPKEAPEAAKETAPVEAADADKGSTEKPKDTPVNDENDVADRACAKCGTVNDADAVFCKKCGARRTHEQEEGAS